MISYATQAGATMAGRDVDVFLSASGAVAEAAESHAARLSQACLGRVEQEGVDDLVRHAGGSKNGRQGRGRVGQGSHREGGQSLGPQVFQVALCGLQEVLQQPLITRGQWWAGWWRRQGCQMKAGGSGTGRR